MWKSSSILTTILASALCAAAAAAQQDPQEWLERCQRTEDDRVSACELREIELPSTGSLIVDASPNGGISVEGWDGDHVQAWAKIRASASTEDRALEIASDVEAQSEPGRIRSRGPRVGRGEVWTVSYDVRVPRNTNLRLSSTNGGLRIDDVSGELRVRTTNGGISLRNVSGDVSGGTTNGPIVAVLTGDRWAGAGLDLSTTNGPIALTVPETYSAELELETVHGGFSSDLGIRMPHRRGGREATFTLGGGGAPIRIGTTNGPITIRQR